jgi:hypothetical protein
MTATLESLEIAQEKIPICKDDIRKMAYFKWLAAGCPEGKDAEFWRAAEHEWIEFQYVPDRSRTSA